MAGSGAVGLSETEAGRRLAARGPLPPLETSRTAASILRANALTPFNAILLVLGVLTLAFADWRDALFLGIIVANTAIGSWQELRAKRKLDALAALVAPRALVVRDGVPRPCAVAELVVGDVVRLAPGDQVVADGPLVEADALELDESVVTGESRPMPRTVGDSVRSGSFAVEGTGAYEVAAIGAESYAGTIAGTAREFRHPRSPLERAIDRLLYILVGAMVPLGALLAVALWKQDVGIRHAVETAVAGMVTLVPEGLILLVSLTFAAAAMRLARRGALAQQLNAIESLASVDTLCADKTGTLTGHGLRVVAVEPVAGTGVEELGRCFGRLAAASPARNGTVEAIAAAFPAEPEAAVRVVPFASRRRWSGVDVGAERLVLGAPELFPLGELAASAAEHQERGRRVVALGRSPTPLPVDPEAGPPPLQPLGIAVLAEELRAEARETVRFLREQGVKLKILSGDDPRTTASIAADAGVDVSAEPVDGRELPDDEASLARVARAATVVGRISPEGKRRVVEALAAGGSYVAMVGDGINDVPALKAARLAIAQGSGTQMARAVSDVVLVSGDFAAVPSMVAEGRRILRNIQRVTKLFVTKSVFAAFLIVAIGLTPTEYPLLPRHLTVVAALTVGIPSFFLALAPSAGPWQTKGFLRDVARFAVPAGVAAGLGVLTAYLVTLDVFDLGLVQARTAATTTLVVVGLYLVLALEATGPKRAGWVAVLCAFLFAVYVALLALSPLRTFFDLAVPRFATIVMVVIGSAVSIGFLAATDDRFVPLRRKVGEEPTGTMDT